MPAPAKARHHAAALAVGANRQQRSSLQARRANGRSVREPRGRWSAASRSSISHATAAPICSARSR